MKRQLIAAALAALSLNACQSKTEKVMLTLDGDGPVVEVKKPSPVSVIANKAIETVSPLPVIVEKPKDELGLVNTLVDVDHLARARKADAEGDRTAALNSARMAVFVNPEDVEVLKFTATIAQKMGRNDLASIAWGRIAGIETDDATPLIRQARTLLKTRDFSGAAIAAREATTRDEGNPESWQSLGLAQLSMGELRGAISSFEKVIDLKPDHGYALNNLGLAFLRANENEKAAEALGEAAKLLPQVAYVQNNLGIALERVGRKDEAQTAYLTATTLSPKYVKARVNADRVARAAIMEELGTTPEEDDVMSDMPHPMQQ